MMKRTRKTSVQFVQKMFAEFGNVSPLEAAETWTLLIALRGPDVGTNQDSLVKEITTGVIRERLGVGTDLGFKFLCVTTSPTQAAVMLLRTEKSLTRAREDWHYLPVHFKQHVARAMRIIQHYESPVVAAEIKAIIQALESTVTRERALADIAEAKLKDE